jgi:hypothetical protein
MPAKAGGSVRSPQGDLTAALQSVVYRTYGLEIPLFERIAITKIIKDQ